MRVAALASTALLLAGTPHISAGQRASPHQLCRQISGGDPTPASRVATQRAGYRSFLTGCGKLRDRDWPGATESFQLAVEQDSTSSIYHMWLSRAYGEELKRANPFRQASLLPLVRGELAKAIELDPTAPDPRFFMIELTLATPPFLGGGVEAATAPVTDLRRLSPYFGALAATRVQLVAGDSTGAERDLLALARQYPDSVAPRTALLGLLIARERLADASTAVIDLQKRASMRVLSDYFVGQIAAVGGRDLKAGEAALRRYITQSRPPGYPARATARWHLARILERQGKVPEAIRELNEALRLNPDLEGAKKDLQRLRPPA